MFDPHSNDWLNSKFAHYRELRSRPKASYSSKYGMYIITRYNDVVFALNNPKIFSSSKGNLIIENPNRFNNTLGASDNPIHDKYKNIVKNAYSKDNIDRIVSVIKSTTKYELNSSERLDLYTFTQKVSASVIAEILNIPYNRSIIEALIIDIQNTAMHTILNSKCRVAHDRLTDLLKDLLYNNVKPTGQGIYYECFNSTHPLVISLFTGPTISGMSSLVGALQFLAIDLYTNKLVDTLLNNKDLIPQAVNESLRFNASTGRFSRTVMEDILIHGIKLKKGDRVALCLESANRDETVFTDPDKFILNRQTSKGLAFGQGIHACIALAISKKCMQVFLEELLDNYGNYNIFIPDNKLDFVMTASGNDDMVTNVIMEKDYATR